MADRRDEVEVEKTESIPSTQSLKDDDEDQHQAPDLAAVTALAEGGGLGGEAAGALQPQGTQYVPQADEEDVVEVVEEGEDVLKPPPDEAEKLLLEAARQSRTPPLDCGIGNVEAAMTTKGVGAAPSATSQNKNIGASTSSASGKSGSSVLEQRSAAAVGSSKQGEIKKDKTRDPPQQPRAEEVRIAGCSENADSPSPKDEKQPKFSLPKARPLRAAVFGFVEQTQRCSNEQKLRSKSSSSSPAGKNKISPKRLRTSCLQDRAQALDPDIRADLQKMKASGSLPVFRNSRSGSGAGPGPAAAAASSRAAAPGEAAPAEVRKTESLPAAEEAGEKLNEDSAPGAQLAQMNLAPKPGEGGKNVAAPPARERSRSGSIVDRMKSYFFSGVGGTQILDVDPGQLHGKDMIKAKDEAGAKGPPGDVVAPAKSSKEEYERTTTTFLGRLGKAGTQLMGSILESQRGSDIENKGRSPGPAAAAAAAVTTSASSSSSCSRPEEKAVEPDTAFRTAACGGVALQPAAPSAAAASTAMAVGGTQIIGSVPPKNVNFGGTQIVNIEQTPDNSVIQGGNNDGGGIDVIDMEDDSEHERIVRMKEKDLDLERGLDVEAPEEPQEEDPNLLLGGGIRKNKSSEVLRVCSSPSPPLMQEMLGTQVIAASPDHPPAASSSSLLTGAPPAAVAAPSSERKEPLVLDQSALPESLRLADHSAPNDDQNKLGSELPQSQDLLNLSARLQNKAEAAERSLLHGDTSARASRKILPGAYTTLMAGGAASNGLQLRSSKKKAGAGLDHKVASAPSAVEQNKLKATTQTMSDSESEGGAKMLSAAKHQRSLASPGAIDCLGVGGVRGGASGDSPAACLAAPELQLGLSMGIITGKSCSSSSSSAAASAFFGQRVLPPSSPKPARRNPFAERDRPLARSPNLLLQIAGTKTDPNNIYGGGNSGRAAKGTSSSRANKGTKGANKPKAAPPVVGLPVLKTNKRKNKKQPPQQPIEDMFSHILADDYVPPDLSAVVEPKSTTKRRKKNDGLGLGVGPAFASSQRSQPNKSSMRSKKSPAGAGAGRADEVSDFCSSRSRVAGAVEVEQDHDQDLRPDAAEEVMIPKSAPQVDASAAPAAPPVRVDQDVLDPAPASSEQRISSDSSWLRQLHDIQLPPATTTSQALPSFLSAEDQKQNRDEEEPVRASGQRAGTVVVPGQLPSQGWPLSPIGPESSAPGAKTAAEQSRKSQPQQSAPAAENEHPPKQIEDRDPYIEDDQVLGAPRAPPSPRTQSAFELALAIREGRVRPRVPSGDIASNLSNVSLSAEIIPRGAAATLVADVVVETGEEQKAQAEAEGACGSQVLTGGADDNDDHEDENKGTGVEGHDVEVEQLVDGGPGMKVDSKQKLQQEREIAVEEVVGGASSSNVDRENGKEAAEGDIKLSFPVTRPLHGLRLHTIIEEDSAALASSPSRSRRASASNRASSKQELREEVEDKDGDAVIVLDDSSSSDERDGGEIENEQNNGGRVNIKKLKIMSKKERTETLNQQQQSVVVKQEQIDGAPSGGNIKSATSSSSRTTTRSRRVAFDLESGCKGVSTPGGAAVAVMDSIKKEIPSEGNLPQEEVLDGAVEIEQGAAPGSAFSCSSKRRKLEQQRTPRKNVEADPSASVNYLVGMKTPFSCGGSACSVAAYDLPMSDCGGEQEEDEFLQDVSALHKQEEDEFLQDVSALHKLDLSAIPQIPEQVATPAQDASVAGLLKQYLPSQGGGNSFGGAVGDQHNMLNKEEEPRRLSLRLTQDELAKLDSDVARSVSQMQKEQRCAGQGVCLLSSAGEPSASGARRNNHEATSAKGNACSSSPSRNVNVSKMQNAPPATSKHTSVKKETLLPPEGEAEGEAGEVDGEDAGNAKRKKKRANYNYRKLKLPDDDVLSSPSAGAGDQQELAGRRLLEVDVKDEERHANALVHYEEQAHQCGQLQVVAAAVPPAARNQNPRVLGNNFSNKRKPCVIATGFRFTEEEREGLTQLGANVVDSWHIDVRFCVLSEDVGFISMKMFCSAAWPESKIVCKHWMQNSLSGGQLQAASGATPPAGFLQTVEREYGGAFRNTEPDEPCLFDPRSGLNAENRFNCVYLYPSVSRGDHKDGILITQLIKALGTTLLKSYPRKQNPRCLFIGKPRDWEHATQKGHKLYRANLLYEAALRRVLNLDRWKIVKVKQEQMEAENGIANEAVADR